MNDEKKAFLVAVAAGRKTVQDYRVSDTDNLLADGLVSIDLTEVKNKEDIEQIAKLPMQITPKGMNLIMGNTSNEESEG